MAQPYGEAAGQPLTGPARAPASGDRADALVILLHGVGADGADLIGLADPWATVLPGAAFVAPNGPSPCDMAPFGYQWFSLLDRDPVRLAEGVADAAPQVDAFIDAEMARHGVGPERTALVGFSQGCMTALYVAPRRTTPLAAVLGYSGALLAPERLADETRSRSPVLLIHGEVDEVVPVQATGLAYQALDGAGFDVDARVERGLGHGIGPVGLRAGMEFLARCLGGQDRRRASGVEDTTQ